MKKKVTKTVRKKEGGPIATPKADKYVAKYEKKQNKRIAKKGFYKGVEMGKRRDEKYDRARYDQAVAGKDGAAKSQVKANKKRKTGGAAPVVYKTGGPTTKSVTNKRGTKRSVTLPDLSKGRRSNRKAVATATKTKKNGKSVTISTTGIGKGKGSLGAHTKTKTKKDGTIKKVKKITLKKAGKAINKAVKKINTVKSKNLKKDIKKIKSNGRSTSIRTAPKMNLGGPGDKRKPRPTKPVRPTTTKPPGWEKREAARKAKVKNKPRTNVLQPLVKTGGAIKKRAKRKR